MIDALKTIGAALATLLITTVLLNAVAGAVLTTEAQNQTADTALTDGSGDLSGISSVDEVYSANTSLNDAARLGGGSDRVDFDASIQTNGTWSLCAWAAADSTVISNNENRAVIGVGDVVVSYNGTADDWRVWYYNESTRTQTDVRVTATTPSDLTLLCASKNATHLTLDVNASGESAVSLTTSGAADPTSLNWDGLVEDVRLYDDQDLNASQRTHLYQHPTLGAPHARPAARVTFDVYARGTDTVDAYFSSGDATLRGGAGFDTGFAGVTLTQGSDYRINGGTVERVAGSQLTGTGDVVYLHLRTGGLTLGLYDQIVNVGVVALGLLVVGLLVFAADRLPRLTGGGL